MCHKFWPMNGALCRSREGSYRSNIWHGMGLPFVWSHLEDPWLSLSLFPNVGRLAKEHVKCLRLETARGWRIEPWVCWLDHACITQHLRFYRGIPSLCCHHDIRVVFLLIGAEMLSRDIEIMIGRGVPVYMRVAWCFVNPALLLVRIYVFTWI